MFGLVLALPLSLSLFWFVVFVSARAEGAEFQPRTLAYLHRLVLRSPQSLAVRISVHVVLLIDSSGHRVNTAEMYTAKIFAGSIFIFSTFTARTQKSKSMHVYVDKLHIHVDKKLVVPKYWRGVDAFCSASAAAAIRS